jgi:parallel beta-helix repeat protein
MSPKQTMSRLGLIASFAVISFITACQKDATTTPNALSSNALTDSGSSMLSKAKSLAISYTGFGTSFTSSGVINLNGAHDITISGKSIIGGSKPAITLNNCYNITITKNQLSNSTDVGIYLHNCKNIKIEYNYILYVSGGVYAENSPDGGIVVNNNEFKNMQGPSPRGQFVQFNAVGGPNNAISNNVGQNVFGHSNPEDAINLFMCNGTAASPIEVTGNWIRGGGPSIDGGGIMLGDYGGSYEVASNNILVDPGQYGIAIAGGDHLSVNNNSIYARAQSFTNVGIYVWGQQGYKVTNSTVSYNQVKYLNSTDQESGSWLASGTTTPTLWSTNNFNANLSSSILPAYILSF